MTVSFSNKWHMASWSRERLITRQNEEALILEMVRNCKDKEVKKYAQHPDAHVYIIAGIHRSKSDIREHATVRLGISTEPYSSVIWPARTVHIYYSQQIIGYEYTSYPGHGKYDTAGTFL